MTQHNWRTTDGFEVLAGWDKPLQHYFVSISRNCPSCKGDGETETGAVCIMCAGRGEQFLFDNLDPRQSQGYTDALGGMNIQQVAAVLNKYLTRWPDNVLHEMMAESAVNEGNKVVRHEDVGAIKA